MSGALGAAAAGGWALDALLGEPPAELHPVAWFGRAMRGVERVTYRDTRAAGVMHVAVGVGAAVVVGRLTERVFGRLLATSLTTGLCVAGRMLGREAGAVLDAVDRGDLAAARSRLPALVGRDPAGLDEAEIVRAVIESVAENTIDAVVASIAWGAACGAPGVLAHRAINTLDAMVGHRDDRYRNFGWAAARLDDVANYVPARLGALAVVALKPARARFIWTAVRRDAPRHPSPNGGVIEAAVAAALGVRLGGRNRYRDMVQDRGTLGAGPAPTASDGRAAIQLTTQLGTIAAGGAILSGLLPGWRWLKGWAPGR